MKSRYLPIVFWGLFVAFGQRGSAQVATNGVDFWGALPYEYSTHTNQVNIASPYGATGTVSCAAISFSQNFTVPAGGIATVTIPSTAGIQNTEVVEQKGIHVTASDTITCNLTRFKPGSGDGAQLISTNSLGTDYMAMTIKSLSYRDGFTFVGTQNGTVLTITPSVNLMSGKLAGVPFNQTLNAGETFMINAATNLTGSTVSAKAPIAVFASNGCSNAPPNEVNCSISNITYCDFLFENMYPTNSWGTEFATGRFMGRTGGDHFRVMALQNGTDVYLNGNVWGSINSGQFVCGTYGGGNYITATKPVSVHQFARGRNADFTPNTDPFHVGIPPYNLWFDNYFWTTGAHPQMSTHHITVVTETANTANVQYDGGPIGVSWTAIAGSPYSYAIKQIIPGAHTLTGAKMYATIYGWGNASESYGYLAGSLINPTIPLPIEWSGLKGVLQNSHDARLSWTTYSEINTERFEIERSTNGSAYAKVHDLQAVGNSNRQINYVWIDRGIRPGTHYYRVKQIDQDGKFDYSNVVQLTVDPVLHFGISNVFQNPAHEKVTFAYKTSSSKIVHMKIFNNIGELVYQQTITPSGNGEHSTSVDLAGAGITEGIYLIYMEQSGKSDISKFIVEP